jgi:hypothetical protein
MEDTYIYNDLLNSIEQILQGIPFDQKQLHIKLTQWIENIRQTNSSASHNDEIIRVYALITKLHLAENIFTYMRHYDEILEIIEPFESKEDRYASPEIISYDPARTPSPSNRNAPAALEFSTREMYPTPQFSSPQRRSSAPSVVATSPNIYLTSPTGQMYSSPRRSSSPGIILTSPNSNLQSSGPIPRESVAHRLSFGGSPRRQNSPSPPRPIAPSGQSYSLFSGSRTMAPTNYVPTAPQSSRSSRRISFGGASPESSFSSPQPEFSSPRTFHTPSTTDEEKQPSRKGVSRKLFQ